MIFLEYVGLRACLSAEKSCKTFVLQDFYYIPFYLSFRLQINPPTALHKAQRDKFRHFSITSHQKRPISPNKKSSILANLFTFRYICARYNNN